ncbi:hypothetical protein PLESTM_002011200 [Pleodorina starrii]|nr:hypothetical protein PLESTM_002011200 [Pleodorina starrii]
MPPAVFFEPRLQQQPLEQQPAAGHAAAPAAQLPLPPNYAQVAGRAQASGNMNGTHSEDRQQKRPPINCRDCGLLRDDIKAHKASGECDRVLQIAGKPPRFNHNERKGGRGGGRFGNGGGRGGGRGGRGQGRQDPSQMQE